MKAFIMIALCAGLSTLTYAQEQKINKTEPASVKIEELPEVVIINAGKDFSTYLPDKNPDMYVKALQGKFVAYDVGKDYEGHQRYFVVMEGEKGSLTATYNEEGKLVSVMENYKNVKLPSAVIYSVYKEFPGWEFVNDKFLYTQEEGDIIKNQYHIEIKKDNQVRKLVVKPTGEIIKSGRLATR